MKKIINIIFPFLLITGLFSCAEDVGDFTVYGEAITNFELDSPSPNDTIIINTGTSDELIDFSWDEATSGLGADVIYSVLIDEIGGDFTTPLLTKKSNSEGNLAVVSVTFGELKALYDQVVQEGESVANVIWTVKAENGSPNEIKAQTAQLLNLKLGTDGISNFNLTSPLNNSLIKLDGETPDETFVFSWEEASATSMSDVLYKLVFDDIDGDFSDPLLSIMSDNDGLSSEVSLSFTDWKTLFEGNGMKDGAFKWTVIAVSNEFEWQKQEAVFYLEFVSWANPIYIVGSGTEVGWNIDEALEVSFVSPNLWTGVYTLINGQEFKFFPEKGSWDNGIGSDRFTNFMGCTEKADGNFIVNTGADGEYVVTVDLNSGTISVFEAPYLVGGSTVVDWNTDNAYPLVRTGKGVFETFEYITTDGWGFKLLPTKGWDGDYGASATTEGLLAQDGENNITVPQDGFYHVKADYNNMTYKVTEVTWGIIGSATPGGWDTDTNMTFTGSGKGDYTWTGNISLTDGEIKFRANDGWDINLGDTDADGSLEPGGTNISVSAGSYTVLMVLDPVAGWSYTLTAN